MAIDLNCDMGEGCGNDAELMKHISSANIACGFHAGDRQTMRETVELALSHNVAIGAHPGYRDRENFGREPIAMSPKEVFEIVLEQIAALNEICTALGANLHHVKPHGALYNQAAKDPGLAAAIAEAVARTNHDLILYGLSGSKLISEGEVAGLRTASEVFADRTYRGDGSLTPRTEADALITDPETSVGQVLQMVESGNVIAATGETVAILAETICVHGDGPNAADFAKRLRQQLEDEGIVVRAM